MNQHEKERTETDMDNLCIIIPAYNEQANIRQVIKQWYPVARAHAGQMVVIDDGSTDHTYEILRSQERKLPHLTVLTKNNSGHGAAVLFGYRYAIRIHADYIFQTDSDGQTLPEEFEDFWRNREHYDMVIGYRKGRHDGRSRVFVTKVLRAVIWLCFSIRVKDANTPYRLIKGETLQRYIDLIPPDFNLANVLVSVIFVKTGCKVKWLPITFQARQGGKNSMNGKKIVKFGISAVRDFRKINQEVNSYCEK